jgi:uncharacterized protein
MTLERLRADAIRRSLFPPVSLRRAINKLGFVQADPIRSPARAQDLILRHRVRDYRAGDLERRYRSLDIEEDLLYAYGFLPRVNWQLLHPRNTAAVSKLERRVFDLVATHSQIHPRDLEAHLGRKREVNAWGGYSKQTTRALERLHFRGLLRIARRENGVRIYEAAPPRMELLSPSERLRRLVLLIAGILAPVPEASLMETLRHLGRCAPGLGYNRKLISSLLEGGELESAPVGGLNYLWPAGRIIAPEPPGVVRFLAPFDPLVWDRRRFEHFWGWRYRFEAYTPPSKRKMGYYAMPVLWADSVIGWANVVSKDGDLEVKLGFIGDRPGTTEFECALEAEIASMRLFLAPNGS